MSISLYVAYVGFEARPRVREYTFQVRQGTEALREFTLTITNEAFLTHRVRYQDAPDICARRLHRELVETENHPLKSHFAISDIELSNYHDAHTPKTRAGAMYKPSREL